MTNPDQQMQMEAQQPTRPEQGIDPITAARLALIESRVKSPEYQLAMEIYAAGRNGGHVEGIPMEPPTPR